MKHVAGLFLRELARLCPEFAEDVLTESPIELAVLEEVLAQSEWSGPEKAVMHGCGSLGRTVVVYRARKDGWELPVFIVPQIEVAEYRLDLAVVSGYASLAVECDGHAFHDKTPDQAEADRRRDRVLQRLGWRVARFTGSEIARNPSRVASEIWTMFTGIGTASVVDVIPVVNPSMRSAGGA